MVRLLVTLILLCVANLLIAQSIDLTLGARHNFNFINGNADYEIASLDDQNRPVISSFSKHTMQRNSEIEYGVRFNTKNNWFFDIQYSNNALAISLDGNTSYPDSVMHSMARNDFDNLYANMGGGSSYQDFESQYYDRVFQQTVANNSHQLNYYEQIKTNNLYFGFGYKFHPHKPVRFYAKTGITIKEVMPKFSYQYLYQSFSEIDNLVPFYNNIPGIARFIGFGNMGFGVDLFRVQLGMNFEFNLTRIEEGSEIDKLDNSGNVVQYYDFTRRLYDNWLRIGFQLNYDLVSIEKLNFNNAKQLKELDHVVTREYERPERKVIIGARLSQSLRYISSRPAQDSVKFVLDRAFDRIENDTIYERRSYQDMVFNSIKRIEASPEIGAYMQLNLHKFMYTETSLSYQFIRTDIGTNETYVEEYEEGQTNKFENAKKTLGAFRYSVDALKLKQILKFRIINHDFARLFGNIGLGIEAWGIRDFETLVAGVNSLDVHNAFYNTYYTNKDMELLAYRKNDAGNYEQFDLQELAWTNQTGYAATIVLGAEIELDRVKFGANYERSLAKIDPITTDRFYNFNLSMAYNLVR